MKKFYSILKIVLWLVVGWFAAMSVYRCYDYISNPEPYQFYSFPWYTDIIIRGVIAAVIILVIAIVMWIVKKKIK